MNFAIPFNQVTAVFGGRFDPPHLGHLEAIRGLFKYPGVRDVLVLPNPTPPHKAAVAPLEDRIAMTRTGLIEPFLKSGSHSVRFDLREVERSRTHPGTPIYSYDSIQEIKREIPKIAFVIGTDQLESFHLWSRHTELLKLCHWIVLGRKPEGIELGRQILQEWATSGLVRKTTQEDQWWLGPDQKNLMILCPTHAPAVSSTEIRVAISKTGVAPENLLLPEVLAYLKSRKLYGLAP